MFADAIGYEQLMGRWSVRFAPLYTEFARLRDVGRVLDVGCGTGALARTIASATRECEIVGGDPAPSFIDYARTRFDDPRIVFQVGDAVQLPFPSAHFDEMKRVTRPGGTVSACTWHRDGLELASIFWGEAVKLDPGADARAQRPKHSNREGQLAALWQSAGLSDVEEAAITMHLPFTSFADFWEPHLRGVAPQGAYVASLSEPRREVLRRALHQRILGDRADGAFTLKAKGLAVAALFLGSRQ